VDNVNNSAFLDGVKQRQQAFVEQLQGINARLALFKEIRGIGLLIGCELNAAWSGKAKQIAQLAAEEGAMVLIAGGNVVRFAPALNISDEEIRIGIERFSHACERFLRYPPYASRGAGKRGFSLPELHRHFRRRSNAGVRY